MSDDSFELYPIDETKRDERGNDLSMFEMDGNPSTKDNLAKYWIEQISCLTDDEMEYPEHVETIQAIYGLEDTIIRAIDYLRSLDCEKAKEEAKVLNYWRASTFCTI